MKARNQNQSGWAIVACMVQAKGSLIACRTAAEGPVDLGFGQAAAAMAESYFRMAAKDAAGDPVEGRQVHISIVFSGLGGPTNPPPPSTYGAGKPAMLMSVLPPTQAKRAGAFACPTASEPDAHCLAHQLYWVVAPEIAVSAPVIRAAGQSSGVSMLNCAVGDKGALVDCSVQGDVTPKGQAALLQLASAFQAPEKTEDKMPTTAGRVIAMFDWAAILKANEVLWPQESR
jgi:hypothetical protein